MASIALNPIGSVHSPRSEAKDDFWGNVTSVIELDSTRFDPEAVLGLTDFSHILVIYYFNLVFPTRASLRAPTIPAEIRSGPASAFSLNARRTGQTNLASRFANYSKWMD